MDRPLEPDDEQWRAMAGQVVDYLSGVLAGLPDARAADLDAPRALLADPALRRPPPEHDRPLAELLAVVDRAGYLRDVAETELPGFAALGPELTRDTRGLRLWLPLHLHGVAAFRAALDEKLDLAAAGSAC